MESERTSGREGLGDSLSGHDGGGVEVGGRARSVYPLTFFSAGRSAGAEEYLRDGAVRKLLAFFEEKGLAALKEEDRGGQWYEDWVAYQAKHGLYAALLSPAAYSTRKGGEDGESFDLLRYARFLEVFAYCSPAHGYSLQVTFLGLFAVLMGTNDALKREAVAWLEAGELLAFGVSERGHGSDLMANEFKITQAGAAAWIANGSKYYIGNAHVASIIAVLGKSEGGGGRGGSHGGGTARMPFVLAALRPAQMKRAFEERKIHTLGVRAAHVGAFEVKNYTLPEGDVIAQGRAAWEAVFGTVTLGKFFLGFGSIGICEHALREAAGHLRARVLYGKPAIEMPHLRSMMAQAYGRLLAMKLYAYRTLDYVHAACADDRRYQLFCAVQKAKVSTEGVKVMALVSECIGAKGFEGDTYCEMALRDAALIPGLEGSMHINLGIAGQFMPRFFRRCAGALAQPPSLLAGEAASRENPYLMEARMGGTHAIEFGWFLEAYRPYGAVANVALFARQAAAFRRFVRRDQAEPTDRSDTQIALALGQCLATLAYGQLVAEQAAKLNIPADLISVIFSLLVMDLSASAMQLAAMPAFAERRGMIERMIRVPRTTSGEWDAMAGRLATFYS